MPGNGEGGAEGEPEDAPPAEEDAPRGPGPGRPEPYRLGPLSVPNLCFTRTERVLLLFLVGMPVAIVLWALDASPTGVFIASALAIIPLSALLGRATEELAIRSGPGLSGLLLATLGNAVELIIAAVAIKEGLLVVAKASMTGSIIVNVLLILGLSFVVGGVKRPVQRFHTVLASATLSMLTVSVVGIMLPSLYHYVQTGFLDAETDTEDLLPISVIISVVLIAVYLLYLLFSLKTHRGIFDGEHLKRKERVRNPEPDLATWSVRTAVAVLAAATVSVAIVSELLVGEIEHVTHEFGLSEIFIGVVIIAAVGNAAEHSTAVLMAYRNRTELSFQIAMGSSGQIGLLVAPVLVLLSFALGNPMALVFDPFELVAIIVTLVIATVITLDGEATWFEGAMLVAIYLLLAAIFYIHY